MPGPLPQAMMHLPAASITAALPSFLSCRLTLPLGGPGSAIIDSNRLSPFFTAAAQQQAEAIRCQRRSFVTSW